jgi:hypothetical protein
MAERLRNKRGRETWHGLFIIMAAKPGRSSASLLRPTAIVPNVGAIYPRDRPTLDAARGALQCLVWNIDIENSLVAFDAISNLIVHGTIPLSLWRPCNSTAKRQA